MLTNKINYHNFISSELRELSLEAEKKSYKMNQKKAYSLSQITGWSIYAFINLVAIASFDVFTWTKLLLIIFLCFTGLILTHLYRKVIIKHHWLEFPLKKLIPRVAVSSVIIGTAMFVLIFLANLLTGTYDIFKFKAATSIMGVFNLSSVILLWSLIYFAVHFFQNYKKAEIESYIWEAAVKDFELKTLKSQLNPHFMFNALNSIRALIDEDPSIAQTAITRLSNILRYSLKIERAEMVSLEDEIQTVNDYLALEAIRFEERLKYNIIIDPKSKRIEIPPMMVQTLVENGIKHGISKRTSGGEIKVETKVEDSKLFIDIKNSGHIDQKALQNSAGFGIDNTKHRLNLLYGEKASFSIKNDAGDIVSVELIIPTGGTIR